MCCLMGACVTNDDFDFYGVDGHKIILKNNIDAGDITYDELVEFIQYDETDKIVYNKTTFMCGDYAERLHNNAEASEIRCGYVIVYFTHDDFIHACNAFITLDRGIIFIDCSSGDTIVDLNPPNSYRKLYLPKPIDGIYNGEIYLPLGRISSYKIYW